MSFLWQLLLRNLRTRELILLVVSLFVATATTTSISIFSSRIQNSTANEASSYMGGDAKISGSLAIDPSWQARAHEQGVATSQQAYFRAMVFHGDHMQLVGVKAVDNHYPLRGQVSLQTSRQTTAIAVDYAPKIGEIWLATRLKSLLQVDIGSPIRLGSKTLRVAGFIEREPDNIQPSLGFAPRATINQADLAATGSVQVGSRVNYSLLLAGSPTQLANLKSELTPQLGYHHRWRFAAEGSQRVNKTLARADQFLMLGGLLSLLLSGIGIALAARHFSEKQMPVVALFKSFGATPKRLTRWYGGLLLTIGAIAITSGAIAGWLLHEWLIILLGGLLPDKLAAPHPSALFIAAIASLTTLIAFSALPLMTLRHISPSMIFQARQLPNQSLLASAAVGFTSLSVLAVIYSHNITLTATALAGLLLIALMASALISGIFALLLKLSHSAHHAWRIGLANVYRHRQINALQVFVFASVFMLLAVLMDLRTGLIDRWQNHIPQDAANHFIFNVFDEELSQLQTLLAKHQVSANPYYPMLRGRIVSVNGVALKDKIIDGGNTMNYRRELNLTWSQKMDSDNHIIAGNWPTPPYSDEILVSAEAEYARGLGLHIGDQLQFSVAGQRINSRLSSIRQVNWDSMKPNFFMIFNQPINQGLGANWVTSFYLPPEKNHLIIDIAQAFPGASLVALDKTLEQIQSIIGKISAAMMFILSLILVAGLVILTISVQATLSERIHESTILRTLGASRSLISKVLMIEFSALGLLAGIIASLGAEISLWALGAKIFSLSFGWHPWLWLLLPISATLLISGIGYYSTRKVVETPPLTVLRKC